jgi:hypothetical protein
MIRAFLGSLILLSLSHAKAGEVSVRDAIDLIERNESKVSWVSFRCEPWEIKVRRQADGTFVDVEPAAKQRVAEFAPGKSGIYRARSDVRFEPSSGRFVVVETRLEKSGVKDDGSANDIFRYFLTRKKFCDNSVVFMVESDGETFKGPPVANNLDAAWKTKGTPLGKQGEILPSNDQSKYAGGNSALKEFGGAWGVNQVGCMACTKYEAPVLLSQFLRSKSLLGETIHISSTANEWAIYVAVLKSHKFPYAIKFFYNPLHGRIQRIEWGGCKKCESSTPDPQDWAPVRTMTYNYGSHPLVPDSTLLVERPEILEEHGTFNAIN